MAWGSQENSSGAAFKSKSWRHGFTFRLIGVLYTHLAHTHTFQLLKNYLFWNDALLNLYLAS
jgi:hypothetical protein